MTILIWGQRLLKAFRRSTASELCYVNTLVNEQGGFKVPRVHTNSTSGFQQLPLVT